MGNDKPKIDRLRQQMKSLGYRPVVEKDLVTGREIIRARVAETSKQVLSLKDIGTHLAEVIEITETPANYTFAMKVTFFRQIRPTLLGAGFTSTENILKDEFIPFDAFSNDYRHFVKA